MANGQTPKGFVPDGPEDTPANTPKGFVPDEAPAPLAPKQDWRDPYTETHPHHLPTAADNATFGSRAQYVGREGVKGIANIGAGALGVVLHPVDTVKGAAKLAWDVTDPRYLATGKTDSPEIRAMDEAIKKHPLETGEQFVGQAAVFDAAGRAIPKAVKGVKGLSPRNKYGPRTVEIAGEKVPVTVGEAAPTSAAGRKALQLKRSGVGAKGFEKVEAAQQVAVKNAMRKLAQETSGAIGPMPEEPGAAMKTGADAVFETARPMYAALDEELVTVPGDFHSASAIVKQAITRAKKLGYDLEASQEAHYGEEPVGTGRPVSDVSHPLTDFQKIRSELGKMRRGSRDPALRYQISEEMKQMTDAMDKALDNTGLKETWKEADRLWAKGYAMNSIADALKSSTKGAESAAQPRGLEVVPSEVKGSSLEETLKDLSDDGTLERGLTHDEISNLRQSANILKRAEGTSTGTGYGESGSRSRAIAHILRGSPAPVAGAAIGGAVGLMAGDFLHGLEAGAFVGFVVQAIGERGLVRVMTKLEGVKALKALEEAKTPAESKAAMKTILVLGATSQNLAPRQNATDAWSQEQR